MADDNICNVGLYYSGRNDAVHLWRESECIYGVHHRYQIKIKIYEYELLLNLEQLSKL